jgi:hypothetical protein
MVRAGYGMRWNSPILWFAEDAGFPGWGCIMFANNIVWRATAFFRSLAFALLFTLSFAADAQADNYRVPQQGVPAIVVEVPAGWTGNYDQYGNLQFAATDHSFGVQFSMISGDEMASATPEAVAAAVFQAAGAPPYLRSEAASVAGYTGTAFIGILPVSGVNLDIRVVLAKVDSTHYLAVSTVTHHEITADQAAAMAELIAHVSVAVN